MRAAAGSSLSTRSMGTNRSRPPILAFSPITGGRPSPSSSRATTSSTRPSRPPPESSSGLPASEDKWTTDSDIPAAAEPSQPDGGFTRRRGAVAVEYLSEEKRDLKLDVACDPLAPSTIRRALAEEANVGEKLGDVMLVASELVTNAVQHSGAAQQERLEVELEIATGRLRFSVSDPGPSGL